MNVPARPVPLKAYQRLTTTQKQQICEYKSRNPQVTHEDIVIHFLKLWRIRLGKSTVGDILRNSSKWMGNESTKRPTCYRWNSESNRCAQMEKELTEWFAQMQHHGLAVDDDMLLTSAKKLGKKCGMPSSLYSQIWLRCFKKRNGLVTVQQQDNNSGSAEVQEDLFGFSLRDVFSFVRTTVVYRDKDSGSKNKVTVFLCSNALGTKKLRPLVVGTIAVDKMALVHYSVVRDSRVIDSALRDWLRDLNVQMHVAERRILLLLDAGECQHLDLKLSNVELLCLPEWTSDVHAAVAQHFKLHYANSLLAHFQSSIGRGREFTVRLVDALRLVKTTWDSISSGTLKDCWRPIGVQETNQEVDVGEVLRNKSNTADEEVRGKDRDENLEPTSSADTTGPTFEFVLQDVVSSDQRSQTFLPLVAGSQQPDTNVRLP